MMSGSTAQEYSKTENVRKVRNWFTDLFIRLRNNIFPKITFAKTDSSLSTSKDIIMEVHWSNNQIGYYKGGSTVWYSYPMMKRCSSSLEYELTNLWEYFKEHGSPYPTAHEEE